MQWILDIISRYTGETDATALREIYDCMCDNVHVFGGLSPDQFRRAAIEAMHLRNYLATDVGRAHIAAIESEYTL
jgi:hypothetical protein